MKRWLPLLAIFVAGCGSGSSVGSFSSGPSDEGPLASRVGWQCKLKLRPGYFGSEGGSAATRSTEKPVEVEGKLKEVHYSFLVLQGDSESHDIIVPTDAVIYMDFYRPAAAQ